MNLVKESLKQCLLVNYNPKYYRLFKNLNLRYRNNIN